MAIVADQLEQGQPAADSPMTKSDLLAQALEAAGVAIMVTDPHGRILAVNAQFTKVTGYAAAEVQDQTPAILNAGQQSTAFWRSFWDALAREGAWQGELWNRHRDGAVYSDWLVVTSLPGVGYVASYTGSARRVLTEDQLRQQAYFDPLTGLVNRRMFADRLDQAVTLLKRIGQTGAVFCIDIDEFLLINERHGHEAGDRVLQSLAARIVSCMRNSDTVARTGGDTFTALCPEIADREGCEVLALRLLSMIREPIRLSSGGEVEINASIGIALFPDGADGAKSVLAAAQGAMRDVKSRGEGGALVASCEAHSS